MSAPDCPTQIFDRNRRRALGFLGAGFLGAGVAAAAWGATGAAHAQIQPQVPFRPGPGRVQGPPVGALEILNDGSFVDTIDGRREGVSFGLDSTHTIRGRGLEDPVQGFIMSIRRAGDQAVNIGSSLLFLSHSDTELVVQVSGISAGQSVWRPGHNEEEAIYMLLTTAGGARQFNFLLPWAIYSCYSGQQNCG